MTRQEAGRRAAAEKARLRLLRTRQNAALKARDAKELRAVVRELMPDVDPRPLHERALRARGSWQP